MRVAGAFVILRVWYNLLETDIRSHTGSRPVRCVIRRQAKERTMIAVRSVQEVISGAVTVRLPAHFTGRRVEVIVLPVEEDEQGPALLEDLLLAAPTLSDEDLKGFAEVREWMNQWTVSEF